MHKLSILLRAYKVCLRGAFFLFIHCNNKFEYFKYSIFYVGII